MRIAYIGDLTVDVYPQKRKVHLGGTSLNSSMWAKRLGAHPSILAAVGDGAAGTKFLQRLKKEHIDYSHVQTLHGTTSNIEIFLDNGGEKRYGEWNPGVLTQYHLESAQYAFLKKHRAASLTVYGATRHLLDEFAGFGKRRKRRMPLLAVDFGDLSEFGKEVQTVAIGLDGVDIAFLGLDKDADEELINSLRELAGETGKLIVVTLGKYGSVAYNGKRVFVQPPKNVVVKDTTGAGDAFLAGFLVSYLNVRNVPTALREGTNLASQVIQKLGAY